MAVNRAHTRTVALLRLLIQLNPPAKLTMWPMNCSSPKKPASSFARFVMNSERTLAIVSTFYSGSLPETSKSSKGRETIIGCASLPFNSLLVNFPIFANASKIWKTGKSLTLPSAAMANKPLIPWDQVKNELGLA